MVNGKKYYYVLYLLLPSIPINLNPKIHAAGWGWICALIFGFLLSIPLIRTTTMNSGLINISTLQKIEVSSSSLLLFLLSDFYFAVI
ncbi:hypothetical protein [Bacillus sp. FJAT-53711]|uniref:hypothetical protein n=1 Tax=Bacillus yunxiaonensis TaxID=3127665 RepID=UPI00301342E3